MTNSSARVDAYSICASVFAYECIGSLTRVCRCCHFEVVMSYRHSPETSGARLCDDDDNYEVKVKAR